jgi:4-hydroxybenzoate polyprenyltransferase
MHFENGAYKDTGTSTNEADTANANTFSGPDATNANNLAIASMVCGILSIVCWFLGHYSWLALPFGIAGLILAFDAKKKGNDSVYRTAGFITSLVGMLFGVILFIACVGCVGCLGMLAVMNGH